MVNNDLKRGSFYDKISVTIRGLEEKSESLIRKYKLSYNHHGNKFGRCWGRLGTKNSQSYVFNAVSFDYSKEVDSMVLELLKQWGGVDI